MTEQQEPATPGSEKTVEKLYWPSIAAGFVFVLVFVWGYHQIAKNYRNDYFANRDDGIITVSHARNWAEFGSIGINPAGERIEGYSSPLQCLLFAPIYAATGMGYALYFEILTYFTAFLLGVLLIEFVRPHYYVGLLLAAASAIALTRDPSFFEWHASGMENPLTHVMFLAAAFSLFRMLDTGQVRVLHLLPVLFATMVRIEAIFHIAPLLVVFTLLWYLLHRNHKGLAFAAAAGGLWVAFFLVRWHYFGAMFPNTASAQDISIASRLRGLFSLDRVLLGEGNRIAAKLLGFHLGMLLPAVPVLLIFAERTRRAWAPFALLSTLVLTSLATPYLFGPARLDETRLTTQMAPAIVFLCAVLAARFTWRWSLVLTLPCLLGAGGYVLHEYAQKPYYLWFSEDVFTGYRNNLLKYRDKNDIFRPTIANADLGLMSWHKDFNIVDLGWLGSPVLAELKDDPAATADYIFDVAAPDLLELHGIWSVQYAYLFQDPRFQERYVPEVSMIDWYLRKEFGRNAAFKAEFGDTVREGYWVRRDMLPAAPKIQVVSRNEDTASAGMLVRNIRTASPPLPDAPSKERALVDRLRDDLTVEAFAEEIAACEAEELSGLDTFYLPRAAYRFLPELRAAGLAAPVVALLDAHAGVLGYPTASLHAAERGSWHRELVAFVRDYSKHRTQAAMDSVYERVFAPRTALAEPRAITPTLTLRDCVLESLPGLQMRLCLLLEAKTPLPLDYGIYIHAQAPRERWRELPPASRGYGFVNWDITHPVPGATTWHQYDKVVLTRTVAWTSAVETLRLGLNYPRTGRIGNELLLGHVALIP